MLVNLLDLMNAAAPATRPGAPNRDGDEFARVLAEARGADRDGNESRRTDGNRPTRHGDGARERTPAEKTDDGDCRPESNAAKTENRECHNHATADAGEAATAPAGPTAPEPKDPAAETSPATHAGCEPQVPSAETLPQSTPCGAAQGNAIIAATPTVNPDTAVPAAPLPAATAPKAMIATPSAIAPATTESAAVNPAATATPSQTNPIQTDPGADAARTARPPAQQPTDEFPVQLVTAAGATTPNAAPKAPATESRRDARSPVAAEKVMAVTSDNAMPRARVDGALLFLAEKFQNAAPGGVGADDAGDAAGLKPTPTPMKFFGGPDAFKAIPAAASNAALGNATPGGAILAQADAGPAKAVAAVSGAPASELLSPSDAGAAKTPAALPLAPAADATLLTATGSAGQLGAARTVTPPTPVLHQAKLNSPIGDVAVHISRAAEKGIDQLSIRLDPPDLGRVDVKLDLHSDGRLHAVISADKPETLDQLQRDARALERALQDAGFKTDSDSLDFNLRGQRRPHDEAGNRPNNSANVDDDAAAATAPAAIAARYAPAAGRLDIRA